jgi:hypothetical protein
MLLFAEQQMQNLFLDQGKFLQVFFQNYQRDQSKRFVRSIEERLNSKDKNCGDDFCRFMLPLFSYCSELTR